MLLVRVDTRLKVRESQNLIAKEKKKLLRFNTVK